jgi:hypothetical protein
MPDNDAMMLAKWGLPGKLGSFTDWAFGADNSGDAGVIGDARNLGSSFLPRDPDASVDWETVVGLEDTDRPAANAAMGCAITAPVTQVSRFRAPRGYVVVYPDDPHGRTGTPVAMLKGVAKTCGLWKQPAKPPIKASDWRCLRRANTVVNKLDRIAKLANNVTGKADLRRTRGKR